MDQNHLKLKENHKENTGTKEEKMKKKIIQTTNKRNYKV